jgi:hypothetical protein
VKNRVDFLTGNYGTLTINKIIFLKHKKHTRPMVFMFDRVTFSDRVTLAYERVTLHSDRVTVAVERVTI